VLAIVGIIIGNKIEVKARYVPLIRFSKEKKNIPENKTSAYFQSHKGQVRVYSYCPCGSICGTAMPTAGGLPQ
jgi:hypothetical protein